jgi:hypothetical protein
MGQQPVPAAAELGSITLSACADFASASETSEEGPEKGTGRAVI